MADINFYAAPRSFVMYISRRNGTLGGGDDNLIEPANDIARRI